jgi:hypothetical protein
VVDRVVGRLTIARLDMEIDAVDDPPTPCFVADPVGEIAPSGLATPLNRLLDLVGAGGMVGTDDHGNVFELMGGQLDAPVVLNVASTGNALLDASGDVAEFAAALQALAAQPAAAQQPAAVQALSMPPGLVVDLSNLGSGLVSHLLAVVGSAGAGVTPARDLSPQQALTLVVAAHNAGELVLTPSPAVTPPVPGQLLTVTDAPIAGVRFKVVNGFPDRKSSAYAPGVHPAPHPRPTASRRPALPMQAPGLEMGGDRGAPCRHQW